MGHNVFSEALPICPKNYYIFNCNSEINRNECKLLQGSGHKKFRTKVYSAMRWQVYEYDKGDMVFVLIVFERLYKTKLYKKFKNLVKIVYANSINKDQNTKNINFTFATGINIQTHKLCGRTFE